MEEIVSQLEQLETTGLIRVAQLEPELEYLFRHNLIQDAAYESLLRQDRRALHREVAAVIERAYADRLEELAAVLAHHYARAEDEERALHYYTLAGDAAGRRYANAEAIENYNAAIKLAVKNSGAETLGHLFVERGHAYELSGDYASALANYVEMADLARKRGDRALELASLMAQATIRTTPTDVHDQDEAARLLNAALEISRALDDRAAEARIEWNLMIHHKFSGDGQEAVRHGEASLKIAREMNLREQMAFTMNDLVTHGYLDAGNLPKARKLIDEVPGLWRELNNMPMLADSLSSAAIVYFLLGEYDNVIRVSDEARRVSESIGNLWGQSYARWTVGQVYAERGEIDAALRTMEEAVSLGRQAGFMGAVVGVGSDLAILLGSLGMAGEGLRWAREAVSTAEEKLSNWLVWPLSVLACLQCWDGDKAGASQTAARIEQQTAGMMIDFPLAILWMGTGLATVRLAADDIAGALRALADLMAYHERTHMHPFYADALYLRGRAYLAQNELGKARADLEAAQAEAEALGSKRMAWKILAALADLEERGGKRTKAAKLRKQAREIVDFIAKHIGREDVRMAFLALPEVKALGG